MRTINQFDPPSLQRPTLWQPICALATVYGVVELGWMVYRVHLPAQITQVGLSPQMVPLLLLLESLLAIAIEPLAGAFSDRTHRWQGTRFPLIGVGVALAALLFVNLPAVALAEPTGIVQWSLVSLLLAGPLAMSCVRSPALALLKRYAPTLQLPRAASLLTFAFGLAGAATPLASPFVLRLGATVSFTLVAILILLSAIWLRWMNPITLAVDEPAEYFNSHQPISLVCLIRVFGLGFAATLAFRLALETFPAILKAELSSVNPPLFVGAIWITLAIAALPIGNLAVQQGNNRTLLMGVVMSALFLGWMPVLRYGIAIAVIVALGLGVGFSLIFNGTLPFALEQVPPDRAGLGIGIFFSGVATANSLLLGVLDKLEMPSPSGAIALGLVALIGAAVGSMSLWR